MTALACKAGGAPAPQSLPTSSRPPSADEGHAASAVPSGVVPATSAPLTDEPTSRVLARGQESPRHLAIDTNEIYWSNRDGGTIAKVGKAGGAVVIVASEQPRPEGIALDDGAVYWATEDAIYRQRKEGRETTKFALLPGGRELLLDGKDLYVATCDRSGVGALYRMDAEGGAKTKLVDHRGCLGPMVQDRDSVMVIERTVASKRQGESGSVLRVAKKGFATSVLLPRLIRPQSLSLNRGILYVADSGNADGFDVCKGGGIERLVLATKKRTSLARGEGCPAAVIADDASLFFAKAVSRGVIERLSMRDDSASVLAESLPTPCLLAKDQTSIYWVSCSQGVIGKLAL